MSPVDQDIRLSKALSYLLRHGAVKEKLNIDASGYIEVTELLKHNRIRNYRATFTDIQRIVDNNNKKRFTLKQVEDKWFICANQGHSIAVTEENLIKLETIDQFPAQLFHGTYSNKIDDIKRDGLKIMGRNHIHLTDNFNYLRKSCDTIIYINVAKCLQDKIIFYKSANEVYLTAGLNGVLAAKYFESVRRRS